MTGWAPGAAVIERLLQERRLERVKGAQADGSPWLERAQQAIAAARLIEQASPDSAFVLAYDAARQACTALLAQQGIRPTTSGGHYAVEESIRAQFGTILRPFGALRRRRNELEYPLDPADRASATEAADGIQAAAELIDAAAKILPNLGIFLSPPTHRVILAEVADGPGRPPAPRSRARKYWRAWSYRGSGGRIMVLTVLSFRKGAAGAGRADKGGWGIAGTADQRRQGRAGGGGSRSPGTTALPAGQRSRTWVIPALVARTAS